MGVLAAETMFLLGLALFCFAAILPRPIAGVKL